MTRPSQAPLFGSEHRTERGRPGAIKHYTNVKREPAPRPWLCCVLAVDTAKNSGWSMWRDGELLFSGEVNTADSGALDALMSDLRYRSREGQERVCVLVLEKPWGGNTPTVMGMAMARERWLRAWKDAGEAAARTLSVHPSTWRAKVLGNIRGLRRDEIRERERRAAALLSPKYIGDLGDDECAALAIGKWASYAAETGSKIGARAVQASMAAWKVGR